MWQSSALVSPTTTLNQDVAIGSMPEAIEESRADVEMGNDEGEKTLGSRNSQSQNESKNPTRREKQEHEDSGHAVCRSWSAACVEG